MVHTKTVEVRIMKFSPYGKAPSICEVSFIQKFQRVPPERVSQTRVGWKNQPFFARDSMLSALYAIAHPSVRPSVCLSACLSEGWIIGKWGKFYPEILRGSLRAAASNKGGVLGKISSFLSLSVNISKAIADTAEVTIND